MEMKTSYVPVVQTVRPQQDYPNSYPAPIQHPFQPQQDQSKRYSWYMPCAILACLFCAWPCGIFAIVYAGKAKTAARFGDFQRAESSAYTARICIALSIVFGIIIIAIAASRVSDIMKNGNTQVGSTVRPGYSWEY